MISPVDCDKHHVPEASEATQHANHATDLTEESPVNQECLPVEHTQHTESIH